MHASTGADALEKLIAHYKSGGTGAPPFNAVLIDLQMPVLDGIEAIRMLRATEEDMRRSVDHAAIFSRARHRNAPQPFHQYMIAVSANSDSETQQEALQAGADIFLPKPFTYGSFLELRVGCPKSSVCYYHVYGAQ